MNDNFMCNKKENALLNLSSKMFEKHISDKYKSISVTKKQIDNNELDDLFLSSFILEGSNISILSQKQLVIFLNQFKNEHF